MTGKIIIGLVGIELNFIERKLIINSGIAGIILFSRNYKNRQQVTSLISTIHTIRETNNLPKAIILIDHEGGVVQRLLREFTPLPCAKHIGKLLSTTPDQGFELIKNIARVTAIELGSIGIDVVLGPVLDLTPLKKTSMNVNRFYSLAPSLIAEVAKCYIDELQNYGLTAAPKHFPGIGKNQVDSHFRIALSDSSLAEMMVNDLTPYQYLIDQTDLRAVMLSHAVYWKIDQSPVNKSSIWLNDILKEKLEFSGLILSDCVQMIGAKNSNEPLLHKIISGLEAGCDLILCSHIYKGTYQEIYTALNNPLIKNYHRQSKLNELKAKHPPKFYLNLLTQPEYFTARNNILDFNKKHKLNKVHLRRSFIQKHFLSKNNSRYQYHCQHLIFKILPRLLKIEYYSRLAWFKLKDSFNRFI